MEGLIVQCLDWYKCVENNDDLIAFVTKYSPLIKRIANYIKCKVPGTVQLDDLIQSGLIGLLEARTNYSTDGGAAFETYASIKIRGAIIDDLRKATGITRDISQNIKAISAARSEIENTSQVGEPISAKVIAQKMGVSEKRYTHMTAEINAYNNISMSDVAVLEAIPCSQSINPLETIEHEDTKISLKQLITTLPKREQQLLALYYNEQLNFKEIADILDLTEARVCQLHALCLEKLRTKYSDYK
jgi:RNA polymerase sigma factor for flagellar operon FliA